MLQLRLPQPTPGSDKTYPLNLAGLRDIIKFFSEIQKSNFVFNDGFVTIRDKIAARTFYLLRKMVLNIVRQDSGNKTSLRGRRKRAGWDDSYMAHLLFNCREITAQDFDA